MSWETTKIPGGYLNIFTPDRLVERIREAIRFSCPNGDGHRTLSLAREELALILEMLDEKARGPLR